MTLLPLFDAGQYRQLVTFQNPTEVSDGFGGIIEGWADLTPSQMRVKIRPAAVSDLERLTAGTVISSATHIVTGPFHAGVTTKTKITFTDVRGRAREFTVAGVVNPEERAIDMVLFCEERIT